MEGGLTCMCEGGCICGTLRYFSYCIMHLISPSSLGENNLQDVLTEMISVADSWKAIGRGLRIDNGHLRTIQADYSGNSRECLSEMLTCWLQRSYNVERFGEPTWRAVVKVVADPAAGDNPALALRIARKHQGNNVFVVSRHAMYIPSNYLSCGTF